MLSKRVWIPILIVLLVVVGSVMFYGQQVATQPDTTRFMPVETPQEQKPSPPGESYETGHWHGDYWHSVAHEPVQSPTVIEDDHSVKDVFLEYQEIIKDEELSPYDRALRAYVKRHNKKYPHCDDYDAVLADAARFAEYAVADAEYMEKYWDLHAEWKQVHFEEYEELRQRAVEIQNIPYDLSKAERLQIVAELQAWQEKSDAITKRQETLRKDKPVSPPPIHTH